MTLRLGVFASHNGTNLQAIIDACTSGTLDGEVVVVLGNNSNAKALERARTAGIPARHISARTHPDEFERDEAILQTLRDADVDLICLAGYNKHLGPNVIRSYRNHILNVHRAPLPRFGGPGMYGDAILEAVLASGVREGGATVHIVDELYDHGRILAFAPMPIYPSDTIDDLAARVLALEHRIYPETIQRIATGEINLDEA